jgi:glutathione synthase
MKLGLVVNDVRTELPLYTTTRLSRAAVRMGHECWTMGAGDFVYASDGSLHAHARSVRNTDHESLEDHMDELQGPDARCERIVIDELDVLLLRNDPSEDKSERPWAQTSGVLFGKLAVSRGVVVLNDPKHLANAMNKTYLQHFPEQVRPKTCISRNVEDIKEFVREHQDQVVIKPLQGSGGQSVFLIRKEDTPNLTQMIEAVIRDGYCIVQEYLPSAVEGDVRLFVMNGQPLMHEGQYAAMRRVNRSGDLRSNMHVGGQSEAVEVTETMLTLVEMVRPRLVRDGMFLVGLDIVDDKLMEINVFSPGGLSSVERLTGIDFADVIIRDLERKIRYRRYYGPLIPNATLATL